MAQNGKGSSPRKQLISTKEFGKNWDRVFGKSPCDSCRCGEKKCWRHDVSVQRQGEGEDDQSLD